MHKYRFLHFCLTVILTVYKLFHDVRRNIKLLKIKAKCNYDVAFFAEGEGHYDAAVSRYYYYLLQSIIYYMNKIPIVLGGKYNQDTRIWTLIKHLKEKDRNKFEENREVLKLQGLKTQRHRSDYYADQIIDTEHKFKVNFKNDFINVERALKTLCVLE